MTISELAPSPFYETRWNGPHPTDYLDGNMIEVKPDTDWQMISRAKWASINFKKYVDAITPNCPLWPSEQRKAEVLQQVMDRTRDSGSGSHITAMFPFEVWLCASGFEVISFDKMNAIDPARLLICEKVEGDTVHGPKGIAMSRVYHHSDGRTVMCAFGFGNTQFVFELGYMDGVWQIPINEQEFTAAIEGKLKRLDN